MKKRILILLATLLLLACDQKNRNHHNFYTDKSDFGFIRIPLIKPYEAVTASSNGEWVVQPGSDTAGLAGTVSGAKHINVIDSVILIHGQNTILGGQPIDEAWFVLIPKNQVVHEFKTHREYLNYTSSIKIRDPKLYDANQILQYFDKKDTLDWQELNRLY